MSQHRVGAGHHSPFERPRAREGASTLGGPRLPALRAKRRWLRLAALALAGWVAAGGGGQAAAADAPPFGVPTAAAPKPLDLEPDGVAFGMNIEGVARLYDRWWDKQFVPRYRKANPGPKTRELDFELAQKKKVLRRVATFDGRSATHDKAEFAEEFAHGNQEAMTSAQLVRQGPAGKDVRYTRRFFFFQNRLWKIYDEYRLEAGGLLGADFKEASSRIESTLGKGAKRTRGPESKWENVVFDAGKTRVRVVRLPSDRVAVIRSDSALAKEVLDRRAQRPQVSNDGLDEDVQAVVR